MRKIAENVWTLRYPFPILGMDFGRVVTVFKLASGKLVIHSTAPFTEADVAAIREFGEPAWILDGTLLHDTFAKEGRAAFPGVPYLAPPDFAKVSRVMTGALTPAPSEWAGELPIFDGNFDRIIVAHGDVAARRSRNRKFDRGLHGFTRINKGSRLIL